MALLHSLFGTKMVKGREINIQETIATLTREPGPDIAAALTARRALLQSAAPVREKYAWLKWDETFEDPPVTGQPWTFRKIVQGMIDNFLGKESEWCWRLNHEVPIPKDAHPLTNPGLELTGPWHPLEMAFNALNSPAPMNMPDFEDASPPGEGVPEPPALPDCSNVAIRSPVWTRAIVSVRTSFTFFGGLGWAHVAGH
jgi:malate synthase